MSTKAKISISLDAETLRLANQGACRLGMSRSAYICLLVREYLHPERREHRLVEALSKIDPEEEKAFAESWK